MPSGVSRGRWIYIAVIVIGCLGWRLLGDASWKDAGSLALFAICVPVILDLFVRRG